MATNARVFVSAGEASGDAYGAALVGEIRRAAKSEILYEGIGGRRMAEAGVNLVASSNSWGAISIVQSLKVVPRVWVGHRVAKRRLRTGKPGLFVAIDFGFANIRLARFAKDHGWKILYFVPPGSWRRDRQGCDLPQITDAISTPFSWSAEILNRMGANAHWFGHPIKQLLRQTQVPQRERSGIAVLPGSRQHEIDENLPLIAQAAEQRHLPKFEFALAPTVPLDAFRSRWRSLAPDRSDEITVGDTAGALRRARAAIVCSGTATLEAALCRCPMVVVYRLSRTVAMEAKLLRIKRPKFIALPNILLDRPVVPELVQDEATPGSLNEHLLGLLPEESKTRRQQLRDFDELDRVLGPDHAITQTADLALSLLNASTA